MPWIPIKRRKPNPYNVVILSSVVGEVLSGYYDEEDDAYRDELGVKLDEGYVNAWMPLPESYKENEE